MFFALVFVPKGYVQEIYTKYVHKIWNSTLPREVFVQQFFSYLHCTYLAEFKVGRYKANSVSFNLEIWSQAANLLGNHPVTNNGAESFNSGEGA